MNLIDTHAHIFLEEFADDLERVIAAAGEAGVSHILMPAVDSATHEALLETAKKHPDICLTMMGLHPCSVTGNYEEELALVQAYLQQGGVVAIGEIGLDFYWSAEYADKQLNAFNQQLNWARDLELPVSIHSRSATDECIKMIQELQDGRLSGVFHCFSGSGEQARQIIDLGFSLGIGGVITFKNGGLDKAIEKIDLHHLVLETDSPYLAPVPYRGKRNEPAYLSQVVKKIAAIKNVAEEEVAATTTANAKKIFAIP